MIDLFDDSELRARYRQPKPVYPTREEIAEWMAGLNARWERLFRD